MFGVLMKHEVKQAGRGLGIIAGFAVLVWLAALVPVWLQIPMLSSLGLAVAIAVPSVLPWALLIYLAVRYYTTMYGRVGYFTMALPVPGRLLFWVKATFALIVGLAGSAFMGAAWLINLAVSGRGASPWTALTEFVSTFGWPIIATVLGVIVLSLAMAISMAAFVITYGSEARFNHLGFGGPVVVGIICYVVTQVVTMIGMLFVPLGIQISPGQPTRLVYESMLPSMLAALNGGTRTEAPVFGLGAVLAIAALCIVTTTWTIRSIERHTSLR